MTQEQKSLLIKDLCARLPHGVKVQDELGRINKLVIGNADLNRLYYNDFSIYSEEKLSLPYLFPFSSITEGQKTRYLNYYLTQKLSTLLMKRIMTIYLQAQLNKQMLLLIIVWLII